MVDLFTSSEMFPTPPRKAGPEQRRMPREMAMLHGRLAYGGLAPRLVGCQILDMTEHGVRAALLIPLEDMPEIVSIEICGIYNRARRCWAHDGEVGLEFILDDTQSLDPM
jgi:hypothetical protein